MIHNVFSQFREHIGTRSVVLVFTGITLATSGITGYKVVHAFTDQNQKSTPQAVQIQTDGNDDAAAVGPGFAGLTAPESGSTVPQSAVRPTATSSVPRPTPTMSAAGFKPAAPVSGTGSVNTAASTQPSDQCLITLFGNTYNVAPLRSTHPGGDIFTCNTDMTVVYQKQHGTNLSRMQPYLVTNTVGGTAAAGATDISSTTGSSSTTVMKNEDTEEVEQELEHHEDTEDHGQSEVHNEPED